MGTAGMAFDDWMKAVDDACYKRAFLSIYDLPDCCYRDWYDDGMSPSKAAARARRAAGE